jgi:hypothetical protein
MRVHVKPAAKHTQVEPVTGKGLLAQLLMVIGLLGLLVGCMDPLEGSAVILPSAAIITLGAMLAKSQVRVFLFWSFIFVACGVGALIGLSSIGGVGRDTGRSLWWLALLIPYAVGVVFSFIGGIIAMVETLGDGGAS